MTPQSAARLTIHVDENASTLVRPGRRLALVHPALPATERLVADGGAHARLARESLRRRSLAGADLVAAAISLLLVIGATGADNPSYVALLGTPLVVLLFKVAGLYDRDQLRVAQSTLDEVPSLLQLTGLYALATTILAPMLTGGSLSSGQIAGLWVLSFIATVIGRGLVRLVVGRLSVPERCLVIGDAELAERFRAKLGSSGARATVVATLPLAHDEFAGWNNPSSLRRVVGDLGIDRVVIAPTATDSRDVTELIRVAKAAGVRVSVLPRMFEVIGSAVEFESVDGLTVLGVRSFGLSRSSRALKRGFDVVVTSLGLLAVAPLLLVIAMAIRLDSKGPVLFRQTRVGRDGQHFSIFKFRSMVVDAEEQKERLRQFNEVGDGMFKLSSDPRITRVGALLRKTSLDEMPQLFNVLRGEMSLVGPRPLVTDEDAQVSGIDRSRLHLTPGMTGPWQVLGARVPMREMVAIDYLYVANWSLWADLKLLVHTMRHVARRGNV